MNRTFSLVNVILLLFVDVYTLVHLTFLSGRHPIVHNALYHLAVHYNLSCRAVLYDCCYLASVVVYESCSSECAIKYMCSM